MMKLRLHLALCASLYGAGQGMLNLGPGGAAWTPAEWFLASEQGAAYWITPDFYGLFQDSLGITPVTGVEQPVGLVLDRRFGGVPIGPDLVTNGDFSAGASGWSLGTGISVSGGAATQAAGSPADYVRQTIGTLVVGKWYRVTYTVSGGADASNYTHVYPNANPAYVQNVDGTYNVTIRASGTQLAIRMVCPTKSLSVDNISAQELPGDHAIQSTAASRPKLSARKNLLLATTTLATQSVTLTATPYTLSFKGTGTVTLTGASTAGPLVGTGANDRVSLTFTPTAGNVTFTVSGSVTDAQLEYGSAVTPYQRVTTATNYDTVGFPHFLKFDGVDDFLVTGNVDFSATDEVTVITGITKFSDAINGYVVSFGSDPSATSGFFMTAPAFNNCAGWGGGSRGTSIASNNNTPNSPGFQRRVITLDAKIGARRFKLRQDGVEICQSTADQGTGYYGAKQIYIGRGFGGTTNAANIEVSSLVIRGAASTTEEIEAAEAFAANLHGVTL